MNFHPEKNELIRRRLMNTREIFIPNRDNKFEKIIEGMVELDNVNTNFIFQEKNEFRKTYLQTDSSIIDFEEDPHLFIYQGSIIPRKR